MVILQNDLALIAGNGRDGAGLFVTVPTAASVGEFCGSSSDGRAPAFQAGCRGFEARLSLTSLKDRGVFQSRTERAAVTHR